MLKNLVLSLYRKIRLKTMAEHHFKKGNPGKPKGATNHLTRTVKESVLEAFNELQSDPKHKLISFAKAYPRDFYNIAAKLIPTELTGTLKTVIKVTDIHD